MDTAKLTGNSRNLRPGIGESAPTQIGSGMNFPVAKLIQILEPNEWEDFTEEWAHSQMSKYKQVIRYTGAGDMGLDILCFTSDELFDGPWDNVQCKRYALQLKPSHIWVELGKIIYYSFIGEFKPPTNNYFAASKGVGLKLKKLFAKPNDRRSS